MHFSFCVSNGRKTTDHIYWKCNLMRKIQLTFGKREKEKKIAIAA